jgi:hypothetical protein
MAKRKRIPTVEIHLTVDGCILAQQPPGVRVIIKDYETDPKEHKTETLVVRYDRQGYEYILGDFPAR